VSGASLYYLEVRAGSAYHDTLTSDTSYPLPADIIDELNNGAMLNWSIDARKLDGQRSPTSIGIHIKK
jgi:hypothetical protein